MDFSCEVDFWFDFFSMDKFWFDMFECFKRFSKKEENIIQVWIYSFYFFESIFFERSNEKTLNSILKLSYRFVIVYIEYRKSTDKLYEKKAANIGPYKSSKIWKILKKNILSYASWYEYKT